MVERREGVQAGVNYGDSRDWERIKRVQVQQKEEEPFHWVAAVFLFKMKNGWTQEEMGDS